MTSLEIRSKFLEFFKSKQHLIVPSAPIVVKNDPSLMFTNAGMNQFKDVFLGNAKPKSDRIANTQKCLRVSGKHNDLEEVGYDTYHHTMFEMLGNWSFGDYFKKEAIEWAWELLTDVFKLDKDRLYVTVFEGDKSDGLEADREAYDFWKEIIQEDRILYGNKADNFWEMGDTGPCGPCSEIHIDLRDEDERSKTDGKELVNKDHPQVIEVWNLVFIEFNRQADGKLVPLPQKHVDTGMGFERLTMALQGKSSNYDTDVFQPLIQYIAKMAHTEYGLDKAKDIALRVIADHLRTVAFAIADGQLPSNTGGGYVIRRILRRAVRYGYTFLGFEEPFVYRIFPVLAEQMASVFPELNQQKDLIIKVIQEEESSFLRTLAHGIRKFEQYIESHKSQKLVDGSFAFELFDTYGFPVDLTALLAREKGLEVAMDDFQTHLNVQRERSRKAAEKASGDWVVLHESNQPTKFVGYEKSETEVQIVRFREVVSKKRKHYEMVFDQTPFYAEAGGQVGDTGTIENEDETIEIFNTVQENNLIIHLSSRLPLHPEKQFIARIDEAKRIATEKNHSATHLMHAALRQVLGPHVEQKGSLVDAERLRFDFSHFGKMSREEIREVEHLVNDKIQMNISSHVQNNVPLTEAKEMGAMALFGEKYEDEVRVISFDPSYSIELCGGTHVDATGTIGSFRIISEGAIAAGVRRIEAVTAKNADRYVDGFIDQIHQIKEVVKSTGDIVKAIQHQAEQNHSLQKKLEQLQQELASAIAEKLMLTTQTHASIPVIQARIQDDVEMAKKIAQEIRQKSEEHISILYGGQENKAMICLSIGSKTAELKSFDASAIIRQVSSEIRGGGGGSKLLATAGGKNVDGLDNAVKKIIEIISA